MAGRGVIGFLQNFGGGEILVIALAALVILGPDRLPELGRSIGRAIHRVRTMSSGVESQVRDVIDDPAMQSIRELGEFAARPRQKLAQYALEAEAEARAGASAPDAQPVTPGESVEPTTPIHSEDPTGAAAVPETAGATGVPVDATDTATAAATDAGGTGTEAVDDPLGDDGSSPAAGRERAAAPLDLRAE